ncbi:alpha,alpha-trehalase TreA [Shimwellia pseudoproteus]|uniref:alpha,alpha-trehalase TreA n=1 Tax=Shimwellia pseudoproteus TaxID=570012 RepID=UPI0018EDCD6E|nr:alpha,alpha-trehalase TreA [Shimwellia pseudoproteus]MBJ3813767.1 alpha,alpha-trehalase TreA [Shimwellia pseudoproteus]
MTVTITKKRPAIIATALRLALVGLVISPLYPAAYAADEIAITQPQAWPQSPDELFGPLFTAVQSAQLFPDQKTFVDAVPRSDPLMILADYRMQRNQSGFDLKHFVEVNFTLPKEGAKYVPPKGETLRKHIDNLWPVLTRATPQAEAWSSLLPLPNPYVVPGGRFREVYYWDSYFTMLGLAESGHMDSVRNMVNNFASEIDQWGHIPNGNRSYYLSRSQPPFFALMVELLAQGDEKTLGHYRPQLEKEYQYWMAGSDNLKPGEAGARVVKMQDGAILNRYWDDKNTPRPESWLQDINTAKSDPARPATDIYRDLRSAAASGWDFSSRWMDDAKKLNTIRTTTIVPVDLNALLFQLEKTLSAASKATGDTAAARHYDELASARQHAMEKYLWNDSKGWYADYDLKKHQVRAQLTAAALFPLYVKAASSDRAAKMGQAVKNHLLQPGGLATTLVHSGQQWDAPNGWAPLQWVAVQGLVNYQQQPLASEVALRFLTNVQHTFNQQQKLVEKYDVSGTGTGGGGGEYPLQDGFGWSNGVALKMLDMLCGSDKTCDNAPASLPAATPAHK